MPMPYREPERACERPGEEEEGVWVVPVSGPPQEPRGSCLVMVFSMVAFVLGLWLALAFA